MRFGGVAGLSGGLIGPDETPRDYAGTLDGTPVFLTGDFNTASHLDWTEATRRARKDEHAQKVMTSEGRTQNKRRPPTRLVDGPTASIAFQSTLSRT